MSGSSAGAAQVMSSRPSLPVDTSVMRAQANELVKALEIEPVGKNFRFDISSAMQKSKSGLIKLLGRGLVGDPVGPKKGMTAEIGVDAGTIGAAGSGTRVVKYTAPPTRTAAKIIGGESPEEKAANLAKALREEAKAI